MVSVNAKFHTLISSESPITRARFYFIPDSTDATNDAAVASDGTLLSSEDHFIDEQGLSLLEMFCKEKNLTIGETLSASMTVTFKNKRTAPGATTGVLDNFGFGRAKVYLDVQDPKDDAWYTCPLGVYIFDIPERRKRLNIDVIGYDQMQKLDAIADDWWDALDFTNGLTLYQVYAALVTQTGFRTQQTAADIVNGSVQYAQKPFEAISMTYRDILGWIAGAACANARFDRNGYIELFFIGATSVKTISADTIPNGIRSYEIAEYTVAAIDKLQVSAAESDIGVIIGTGTNGYQIVENGFLFGATQSEIAAKAQPIYNVLSSASAYSPISASIINGDCAYQPGDRITFTADSVSYTVPVMQQTIRWRGSFVNTSIFSSGDPARPTMTAANRYEYRTRKLIHTLEVTAERLLSRINNFDGSGSTIEQLISAINLEIASKVDDDEIISAINLSPEQIKILASKISLLGYVTINDGFSVDQNGYVTMKGATVDGEFTSQYEDTLTGKIGKFHIGDSSETGFYRPDQTLYFGSDLLYRLWFDNDYPSESFGGNKIGAIMELGNDADGTVMTLNAADRCVYGEMSGLVYDGTANAVTLNKFQPNSVYIGIIVVHNINTGATVGKRVSFLHTVGRDNFGSGSSTDIVGYSRIFSTGSGSYTARYNTGSTITLYADNPGEVVRYNVLRLL